jgi:hypothetical protein
MSNLERLLLLIVLSFVVVMLFAEMLKRFVFKREVNAWDMERSAIYLLLAVAVVYAAYEQFLK